MFPEFSAYLSDLSAEASILALLVMAVFGVLLTRALKLPSMLAYLAIGVLINAPGINLLQGEAHVSEFGEFGIAFLMFSIGLEFSVSRLRQMRSLVLGLGPAQILLSAAGTMLVTWFGYQQGWRPGFAVGLAVAMSSTAIMAKLLSERFELHSRHGRRTMAVLLFQDLVVVPSLIVIPALAQQSENLANLIASSLLITVVTLFMMFWLGRILVNYLFTLVSRFHSPELFMLTVLLIVLGLSLTTDAAGLSQAMGAFIGGILVSETMYRHEVEADIRPFRDILLGLFFVSIGMLLDVKYVIHHVPVIILGLLLLLLGKATVVVLVSRLNRTPWPTAIRCAGQLAIAGEFGIVLLTLAFKHALISDEILQSTLAVMLLSMFLTPAVLALSARWADRLERALPIEGGKDINHHANTPMVDLRDADNHVVICGFGRTGRLVAEFLSAENLSWTAIDVNALRIEQGVHEFGSVVFGRAERPEILSAAGIRSARLVVICFPDPAAVERMLPAIRRFRADVRIVVRAPDDTHRERLLALGANEVIPEVFESGLALAEEVMLQLDIPIAKTHPKVQAARDARYKRSAA